MSTELPAETQRFSQTRPRTVRQEASTARWRKRGLLAFGAIALVALANALIPQANSSPEIDPKLTHTITRGNLIVTVTEQGRLESAENTEIKCKVRGQSTVIWVIEGGTEVTPGDELVRLDTLAIEDAISERTKYAHWSRSSAERAKSTVLTAELAISEYLEGRYRSELMSMEKDLAIAQSNWRTARNMLDHATMLAERGYVSALEIEERTFAVTRTELNVAVKETEIDTLKRFTKAMELETLKGNLNAAKANLAAAEERATMDAARRDLALEELEHCVVEAERSGLVIYPSAAKWESGPEIEEGATVHKEQVLLLMPDLSKMQVKVGIHESVIDRIQPGLAAKVSLPNKTLDGKVSSVATVTAPAGWWTGNMVKYDTIIELPAVDGLHPGMSAEVEVIVGQHENVLTIPVAPVVRTAEGEFCWVKTADGIQKRSLRLGATNDVFSVVEAGLKEGDEVVLNPRPFVEAAKLVVLKPIEKTKQEQPESSESGTKKKPQQQGSGAAASKPAGNKPTASKPTASKPAAAAK